MTKKAIHIEVVSDPVCPWCYIGKRRLESAIAQRPDLDITVEWLPFQLNPNMPRAGRNRWDYYRDKFGDQQAESLLERLGHAGAEEGMVFCRAPEAMAPNTLSAHVLMSWANEDQTVDDNELAEKLFYAHHIACENIGDHDLLARIAGEAGMDAAAVAERLASGEDEDKVKQQLNQSLSRGVSGVPFFVINGQYGISGAQPPATLVTAFDQIAAKEGEAE